MDRVLVLVRLNGGNDGLNTVIPLDQYDNLKLLRSNILIPESKVLRAAGNLGFHPAFSEVADLFGEGQCKLIQNVAYPNQNRSHFRSMEIWSTGQPQEVLEDYGTTTGWLGRFLDLQHNGFPEGYPNEQHPDPFGVSMGYFVSETCQGRAANFSMALNDPFSLAQVPPGEQGNPEDSYFAEEVRFFRQTAAQTNAYGLRITEAAERGANLATYPKTDLADQLRKVALLISGGLRTKIYVVNLGGFDTHRNQADSSDPFRGRHPELLSTLSQAISAFQQDLAKSGNQSRVLTMTFSEFGRQIAANNSGGTDHGTAAPLFLFGPCVNPEVLGNNPLIPRNIEKGAGVPMAFDFRDVYGTVLRDWFGVPTSEVRQILHADFTPLDLLNGCDIPPAPEPDQPEPIDPGSFEVRLAPNPCDDYFRIFFTAKTRELCSITIVNSQGNLQLKRVDNIRVRGGEEVFKIDCAAWRQDTYYVTVELETQGVSTSSVLKL